MFDREALGAAVVSIFDGGDNARDLSPDRVELLTIRRELLRAQRC